jgi:hypothetical protein
MKKICCIAVVAVAVAIAAAAWAQFSVPSKTPTSGREVMDTGGKMGLEKALNSKLEKANCTFKGNTADTTCDLKKIGNELAAVYQGAKEKNYRVEVKIVADNSPSKKNPVSGSERASKVRDNLRTGAGSLVDSWDFSPSDSGQTGQKALISARVR